MTHLIVLCAYSPGTVQCVTFQNDHFQINKCIDRAGQLTVQKGMEEGTHSRMTVYTTVIFEIVPLILIHWGHRQYEGIGYNSLCLRWKQQIIQVLLKVLVKSYDGLILANSLFPAVSSSCLVEGVLSAILDWAEALQAESSITNLQRFFLFFFEYDFWGVSGDV